ncbi:class I SAM-dependent methyltransferase [Pseudorhizobium endolithicum]|uniref:Class I SAM-dependent methyltransferase n=1 Tax=Pseudorhizobium endolithicum TaxID=1191678 RepID=A0ABN7JRB6_9HYPH|nr:class I SAM-dependent methyltransferase [Pseudorhizobium endolithicum]CAD6406451.1 methyltransferase type 11 [Rhizobium sp. Q54]CAD7038974.1 class I SAM-dependent methyltransferase [Pseudorhizobium endolithicum]
MSGFDIRWLDLREPADRRARDAGLLAAALAAIHRAGTARVLDIGCGTGSTYRMLRTWLRSTVQWQLLDRDPRLLAEARRRHGGDALTFVEGDLAELERLPLEGAALVTASALFDLCSADFMARFVCRLRRAGVGLYAALNYDGEMSWSHRHPLDDEVVKSFNAHQSRDKGFGAAAGPDAWSILSDNLHAQDFRIMTAASPWILGGQDAELQRSLLDGIVEAVAEEGNLSAKDLQDWHAYRIAAITSPVSSCRVGHQDVLALC